MSIETRDHSRVAAQESSFERLLKLGSRYTTRASRENVESLRRYLATRRDILSNAGDTDDEMRIINSMEIQIERSLNRNKRNGGLVVLALKIDDVVGLGNQIIERGVRLPPLLRAVSEIVRGKDEFSDIGHYCQSVLDELANMPGDLSLARSLKRLFLRRRGRKA